MNYYEWTLTWNTVLAISTVVMAVAIVVTAIFAIVQLWNFKKARYSTLLMQLDLTWDSIEYIHSRMMINQYGYGSTPEEESQNLKEAIISFSEANSEEYFLMIRIANFFENLGFLVCNDYLNRKDALALFESAARRYWSLFGGFARYRRDESTPKQPDAWVYFEDLSTIGLKKNRRLKTIKTPISKIRTLISRNTNQ